MINFLEQAVIYYNVTEYCVVFISITIKTCCFLSFFFYSEYEEGEAVEVKGMFLG